jgi:ribonuclease Z
MNMKIASTALHATFLYSHEHRFLLDAGEGVIRELGDSVCGLTNIFLTHDHIDHVAGLPTLLSVRNRQKDASKLNIYFPVGSPDIQNWRKVIGRSSNVEWIGVEPGTEIAISSSLTMRAFETRHLKAAAGCKSLGYLLIERRTRLKPEYQGLSDKERSELVKQAKKATGMRPLLSEPFERSLLAYTGDTAPLPEATLRALGEPEVLFHDTTFLHFGDRGNEETHSTLKEAIDSARIAGAKRLVGIHLSKRYSPNAAVWDRINAGLPGGVRLISPGITYDDFDTNSGSCLTPIQSQRTVYSLQVNPILPTQSNIFSAFMQDTPLRNSKCEVY